MSLVMIGLFLLLFFVGFLAMVADRQDMHVEADILGTVAVGVLFALMVVMFL